jgi:hypothetical protein
MRTPRASIAAIAIAAGCVKATTVPYGALSVVKLDSVGSLRERIARAITTADRESVEYLAGYYRYLAPRALPRDTIDRTRYLAALDHQLHMPVPIWVKHLAGGAWREPPHTGSGTWRNHALMRGWRLVGPTNIVAGGSNESGRVNAIAYDAANPTIIYVASAQGGLWRSTSRGQTWEPLSDDWPTLATSSIAIDPIDPSTLYVGTGDFPGVIGYAAGIMKSTDGGGSWSQLGTAELGTAAIPRILVDPDHPEIVVAAAANGLWRSTNGGASWDRAQTSSGAIPTSIFFDAEIGGPSKSASSGRWYFAIASRGGQAFVYRSPDRGETWTEQAVPQTSTNQYGLQLAVSPLDGDRLYVLLGADENVLQSTDAAASWTGDRGDLTQADWDWNQSWYDYALACSSSQGHDVVYVGLKHIFQSTTLAKWTQIARAHDDQHVIEIDPHNADQMLVGSDGGIHRETWTHTGDGWSLEGLNVGLATALFYSVATSQANPSVVIGGTQDNGTIGVFGDEGTTLDPAMQWRYLANGDGGVAAINGDDDNIQYADDSQGAYGLFRTGDRWQSRKEITPPANGSPMAPVALDPTNPRLAYWGTDYLYQHDDRSGRWVAQLGNQKLADCTYCFITTIAVAPSDPFHIYVGTSDGKLWMTGFAGNAWLEIGAGTLPGYPVESISISPNDPEQILVGLGSTGGDHVWRCEHASSSSRVWTSVSGAGVSALPDAAVWAITRDFREPSTSFWVGTDLGVFFSNDAGASWIDAGPKFGMPRAIVSGLEILSNGELQASTFGRGIWRLPLRMVENDTADFDVVAHVQDRGDVRDHAYAWLGSKHADKRIEGFEIDPASAWSDLGVEAMGHVQDHGDTAWVPAGTFVGTRGESRRLEGFAVRLTGAQAKDYDVLYQAHLAGTGDTRVYRNGEFCGTRGESRAIEAIRIWIAHK